jgi:hypothetical protein
MGNHQEFYGHEIGHLSGSIWRAGGVNSRVTPRSATVRRPSFCLEKGVPYEMEGALAPTESQARALAVVQDLERIKTHLTPPIDPRVLYERRQPIMTCIEPQDIEVIYLDADADRERLGLDEEPDDLAEAAAVRRRVVRDLRTLGWKGAIVLPAFAGDSKMVVVSREYLLAGALRVWRRGALVDRVPPELVDFALGLRGDFPSEAEVGLLPLEAPPLRLVTTSWRPVPPSPRVSDSPRG